MSAEVFEESDGSLRNVHAAVARGRQMRCELCRRPGATVGCCLSSCVANYHFMCARRRHAAFQSDKKVFCQRHIQLLDGTSLVEGSGFSVLRRVFVDFAGMNFKRKFLGGLEPSAVHIMIGSIRIDSLGALTELSECDGRLYPVGYQCRRLYWSTRDARRRCWYRCRIVEHRPENGTENGTEPREPPEDNRTIVHGTNGEQRNRDLEPIGYHRAPRTQMSPISHRTPNPIGHLEHIGNLEHIGHLEPKCLLEPIGHPIP
ncbi:histone-lysine N-methyltransferase 2B-like [Coturnix japonica]|uniref:histone-lysine N-methyltransferase 2B-like n=1 Tax=Coturnix japonica TaxID=93934 RepID=UPI00077728C7|nr:histone-lysine N-methyltransferase 2B-like [Coturnix japonica]